MNRRVETENMGKPYFKNLKLLKWITMSLGGVGLCAALFVMIDLPEPEPQFGVRLDQMSRVAPDTFSARLSVTNESAETLVIHFCDVQMNDGSGWATNLVVHPAGKVLAGRSVVQVDIPLPGCVDQWRVPYYWGYQPTGLRKLKSTIDYNIELNRVRRSRGRSLRFINNFSTTMTLGHTPAFVVPDERVERDGKRDGGESEMVESTESP